VLALPSYLGDMAVPSPCANPDVFSAKRHAPEESRISVLIADSS
jgi:hypothetical protein